MTPQASKQDNHRSTTAWIPEAEGEILAGEVQEVIDAWSDQRQGFYPLLIVKEDDGTVRGLHGFTAVLNNEILRKQPMPGDRIEVTFLGVSGNAKPGQNPAKRYRVKVPGKEGRQAENAYGRLTGQGQQLAPPVEIDAPADARGLDEEIPF